jgi:hypothetical protein
MSVRCVIWALADCPTHCSTQGDDVPHQQYIPDAMLAWLTRTAFAAGFADLLLNVSSSLLLSLFFHVRRSPTSLLRLSQELLPWRRPAKGHACHFRLGWVGLGAQHTAACRHTAVVQQCSRCIPHLNGVGRLGASRMFGDEDTMVLQLLLMALSIVLGADRTGR